MKSIILILISLCTVKAATPTTDIKVDQVGYMPDMPKLAMVVSNKPSADFTVRRVRDGSIAFTGKLSAPVADADSGDQVQIAEFTELSESGEYYIEIPAVGRSWDFAIRPNVYSRAFYLVMRSFYGQRCGAAVDLGPEFPGYKHAACHLKGSYHSSSGKKGPQASTRGWHDAGDFGRYIVNSGITTGTLLWTWELFGKRAKELKLNIPESKNNVPDFLDEIK
jgi:endoglucanase